MASDPFDPFGFRAMQRQQDAACALARKAAPGLPLEHLTPGALITISTNKATGDRSYTDDVLEVLATSAGSVSVRALGLSGFDRQGRIITLQFHEHEFYAAEGLAEAMRAACEVRR